LRPEAAAEAPGPAEAAASEEIAAAAPTPAPESPAPDTAAASPAEPEESPEEAPPAASGQEQAEPPSPPDESHIADAESGIPLAGEAAASETADAPTASAEEEVAVAEVPRSAEAAVADPPGPSARSNAVELAPLGLVGSAEAGASEPAPTGGAEAATVESPLGISGAEARTESADSGGEATAGTAEARDISIKAAEVEAETLYVAGEAPPGTLLRIYADDRLVGEARAGSEGTWLLEAQTPVSIGEVVMRAEAASESGVDPTVRAEVPFVRFSEGIVLEPIGGELAAANDIFSATGNLAGPAYIIIRRGDSLWRIARRNYGRGIKYHAIFDANRDLIRNPHRIFPGQVFVIPARDRSWEAAAN
jgi:nucleoid-associated protein YgaU